MRRSAWATGAAAALTVALLAGSAGTASADGGVIPPVPGLPTVPVTVPTLPVPTPSLPLPIPTTTSPPSTHPPGTHPPGTHPSDPSSGESTPGASTGAAQGGGQSSHRGQGPKPRSTVTPMIAGTPAALDVVDDESTPAMRRASKDFLSIDEKIAALIKARDAMEAVRAAADRAESTYASLQVDAVATRSQATTLQSRYDRLHRAIVNDAVRSYQVGRATTDDRTTRGLVAAAANALDGAHRADAQVGALSAAQNRAEIDFGRLMRQYFTMAHDLSNVDQRLDALGKQRAAALAAAQAAKSADVSRSRQSIAESGQLGAEIRAASARLAAAGRTVQGTGDFIRPSSGVITSPYGTRMHPILHYVKLHTGTDFAVGDGFSHAADTGRVLFTIVSVSYGNFTVIDHGTINGRHVTTAYAHQAKFLVKPGDVVAKGQKIGIIGSTGYATGPHLHFEVRDDGAVEDPMAWLR
jgi:murein DD-endopeptidase MepM/ murein hydrolase activator NlpD